MHRIDSSTATPDNRFTEGDPTIPLPATTVTAAWLNALQEEAIAVLAAAGIAPDKVNNAQVLAAIRKLIADSKPGIATTLANGICRPDGVTINIDATGKLTAASAVYVTAGDCDLLAPGFYICDNTAGAITHAPTVNGTPYRGAFVLSKRGLPSGSSWLICDHAVTFEGVVHEWHRAFVPTRGSWSAWTDTVEIPAYSKVMRAAAAISARLNLQAVAGNDNVALWVNNGELVVSRNGGDTTDEYEAMFLNPKNGTINGVLPAPRPTASNFVVCGATLPAGGTWAYCVNCWNSTGYYVQT